MAKGETMTASRLGLKATATVKDEEVVDPTIGAVNPIETEAEQVNSLMAAEVVDSTTSVVDSTTVKTKLFDSFIEEEVVDTWAMILVVDAIRTLPIKGGKNT